MAAKTVKCVKLKEELPALDPTTAKGSQAQRMCKLYGGQELADRVMENVSEQAWALWSDYMRMVLNEYRLDPTAPESNAVLRQHMEDFFFGGEREIPNYVPPEEE